jgi:AcrR family transcriptional regulator
MGRSTQAESVITATRILGEAQLLFADRDYRSVSLDDVARAAHVTRGAVYHHFGSREGLFARVHDELQARVADAIDQATRGIDDAEESLRAGSRAFLATIVGQAYRQILLIDAPAVLGWDRWRAVDTENSGEHLLVVLRQVQAEGRLRSGDPEASRAVLSGAMNELALWVAHHPDPEAGLRRAEAALAILIDGEIAD